MSEHFREEEHRLVAAFEANKIGVTLLSDHEEVLADTIVLDEEKGVVIYGTYYTADDTPYLAEFVVCRTNEDTTTPSVHFDGAQKTSLLSYEEDPQRLFTAFHSTGAFEAYLRQVDANLVLLAQNGPTPK